MTSAANRFSLRQVRNLVLLLAAAAQVVSCGGGASEGNSSDGTDTGSANHPPVISGSPVLRVTAGQAYAFTPTASDADGDSLAFSVTNPPGWAAFDSTTGSLSGTPEPADVGITSDVTISVSDGRATSSLDPFDLEVEAVRLGSAILSWDAPTTNADGSTLTDLKGFRVYYGKATNDYTSMLEVNDAGAVSAVIENLEPATWFFVVVAVDEAGNLSAYSTEVSKVVQP